MSSPWDAPAGSRPASRPKDEIDRIAENVTKLLQNVSAMKKMVPDMGTPRDSVSLRSRLKTARETSSQLASETMRILQTQKKELGDPVVKRRYTKVLETYSQAVTDFQTIEKAYSVSERQFAVPAAAPAVCA
jgi:hypothetical protein